MKPHLSPRKNSSSIFQKAGAILSSLLCLANAFALPSGGHLIDGQVEFNQEGQQLTIDQLTDKAIINWDDFQIALGEGTTFNMPGIDSAVLNRVVGDALSRIDGDLLANGRVFLINENGVIVGQSGRIDTGSFVGSTLDLSDEQFLNGGDLLFEGSGQGIFVNLGKIQSVSGDIFIVSTQIKNSGTISSEEGIVGLGAGSEVLLRSSDPSQKLLVRATVDSSSIENRGVIEGTQAELRALGGNEFAMAINNEGAIRASGVRQENGRILLVAEQGTTSHSGSLSAAGGEVQVLGNRLALTGEASVDVSSATGGGQVLIGGDFQGGNDEVKNAQRTFVGSGVSINADATENGNGGRVIVWADGDTRYQGSISAQGAGDGQGGFVEVSGKEDLAFRGSVLAAELLLDPKNIIIDDSGTANSEDVDAFADTPTVDVTITPGTITTLTDAGTSVTFQANNDITVNNSIVTNRDGADGGDMTFQAGRSISLYANIDSDNGDISFTTNDGTVTVNRDAGAARFLNSSLIDAGTGTVTITMGDGAGVTGESGTIEAGQLTVQNLIIVHNGATAGVSTGQIDLGETYVSGGMSITTSMDRNLVNTAGSVTSRGTTTVNVGAGEVDFSRSTTNLNIFAVTAGDVVINDSDALRFGNSSIGGNLTVATEGPLASTGAIVVAGSTSLTATNGGFGYADPYVSLTNAGNDFQGSVLIDVQGTGESGTGGHASIVDANEIDFSSVNVARNLTVQANGAVTDSGNILVGEQATLTAGAANDITLDGAGNNFGYIQINSANNATLNDIDAIEFGYSASSISGDLAVTAGGNISQYAGDYSNSSPVTVGGNTTFTVTAANSDLKFGPSASYYNIGYTGAANSFAGTVTLATSGAGSYRDVQLRNTSATAGVVSGLGAGLSNVLFYFDNAPSLDLPSMSLSGNLIVDAPSAEITQSGAIVVDNSGGGYGYSTFRGNSAKDITLDNANNDFYRIRVRDGRDVSITDTDAIDLYSANYHFQVRRDLSVTAGGDITDTSVGGYYIRAGDGTASFDSGSGDITLNNFSSDWDTVSLNSDGNVSFRTSTDLILDTSDVAGTLYFESSSQSNTLTQVADSTLTTVGTTTFNYFESVNLPSANNVLGDIALTNFLTNAPITIRENDAITQGNAWGNYAVVSLTTSDDQAITLDENNVLGDVTITQINNGNLTPGAVLVRESHDIDQSSAWTTHGETYIDSNGQDIYLTEAGNVLGPLKVEGDETYIYENDTIEDYSNWTTTNDTHLRAYASGVLGDGNIVLDHASNVLGDLQLTAADATIVENSAITDGDAWNVDGTVSLNAGSSAIALNNVSNSLGDIAISGTPSSVLITDNTDLTQASAWDIGTAPLTLDARTNNIVLTESGNKLGAITIETANGTPNSVSITEDAAITQGSAWNFPSKSVTLIAENDNSITLTESANIMGNLTITGGAVSITENDDITDGGAWTTTGDTTLNPQNAANDILLDNVGNVLGDLLISGVPTLVRIIENDDITQSAAWSLSGVPIVLSALNGRDILLTEANNILGDLELSTVSGGDVSVVENDDITDGNAWSVDGTATVTAGSNDVVINANPIATIGSMHVVSADAVTVDADMDSIRIDSANTVDASDSDELSVVSADVAGTLTIDADGHVTQTGAIESDKLLIIGSGYATLTHADNNVATLAAGFTGGDLTYSDVDNFQVNSVGGTTGVGIGPNGVSLTSVGGSVTGINNISADSSSLTIVTGDELELPSLSISGAQTYTAGGTGIVLNGNLTSSEAGAITFNSATRLATDATVLSANDVIDFNGTIDGDGNILTVNAGTAGVDFASAVSGLGDIGDAGAALNLTSSGAVFQSTLAANNGINVTGPVTFRDDVTLGDGNASNVFSGLVTFAKAGDVNFSAYDTIRFSGGVVLSGDATINSNNTLITFEGANTIGGANALTLNAGTGNIVGIDHVASDLSRLDVTARSIIIPSAGVSMAGSQSYTATDNSSITLNGDVASTASGAIVFNSPVSLGASVSVSSTDSSIIFVDTVNGSHDLSLSAGTGLTEFQDRVGNAYELGDGTGAALTLNSGSGATTFADTVEISSGIVHSGTGSVTFQNDLTIGSGDTGTSIVGPVTIGRSGAETLVFSQGNLTFVGTLTLADGDLAIESNGSDVDFQSTIASTGNDLSVTSADGSVTIGDTLNSDSDVSLDLGSGSVSGLQRLGATVNNLTVDSSSAITVPTVTVSGKQTFNTGAITLQGDLTGTGLEFNTPVTVDYDGGELNGRTGTVDFNNTLGLGSNDITLTGDEIDFAELVTGTGVLVLQPYTAGTDTFVGGLSNSAGLDLLASDVAQLPNTLERLVVGQNSGAGSLDFVGDLELGTTAVTLRGGTGITQSGGHLVAGATTFDTAGSVAMTDASNDMGGIDFAQTPSSVSITEAGSITQANEWELAGIDVTLDAGSNAVTLDDVDNTLGKVSIVAGEATLVEDEGIHLGDVEASELTLAAAGTVTQDASTHLDISGDLTITTTHNAGDVFIDNSGAATTTLGAVLVGGDFDLNATGAALTQDLSESVKVAGDFAPISASVSMSGASNIFGNYSGVAADTVVVRQAGVITLGDRVEAGSLSVTSVAGGQTFDSVINGQAISLDSAANNIGGTLNITTDADNITVGAQVQTGINQTPGTSLQVTGMASFVAENSSAASSGIIDLTEAGNQFGSLYVSGTEVSVIEAGAMEVAGANVSGELNLESSDAIAQSGAIATNKLILTLGNDSTLAHADNQIDSLEGQTSGNDLTLSNSQSLDIGANGLDLGDGNLNLIVTTGNLAQSGTLLNVDTLSASAAGAVTLDDASNDIAQIGLSHAGDSLKIVDGVDDLAVSGNVNADGGQLEIVANGDLTLNDGVTVATSGANDIVLAAGDNFINNESTENGSALSLDTGRYIVYTTNLDDTVKGGLQGQASLFNSDYISTAPGTVGNAGKNMFVYAFTPTLTFTADDKSRQYGFANDALTFSISGLLDGDTAGIVFSGAPTLSTGVQQSSFVGDYDIDAALGSLSSLKGYSFAFDSGTYTIDPRAITVAVDAESKVYGNIDPTFGYSISSGSLFGSDDLAVVLSRAAGENVGAYAIQQDSLTIDDGNSGANYAVNFVGANLSITPRAINIAADAASKTYGDADPSLSYQLTGGSLAFDDAITGALSRAAGENVGNYAIGQNTVVVDDGNSGNNYAINYTGADLSIDKLAISIAADGANKTYGDADPSLTYQLTGGSLAFDDAFTGALNRAAGENVGGYAIGQNTVTVDDGNSGGNYAISYTGADLSIDKRAVSIAADAANKTYGNADPSLTYQLTDGSLAFDDAFTGALNREVGENVGDYAIGQNTVTVDDGNSGDNYDITYTGSDLTIGKRAITIAADAASKTYGAADPSLTYQLTDGSLAFDDAFTGSLNRPIGENVGSYAIGQSTLTVDDGNASENYAISYQGADLSIEKATLNIAANASSKTYGDVDPSFEYNVTGLVVNAELGIDDSELALDGSLGRVSGENIGAYAMTAGTLADSSGNYAINFASADLSIGKRGITIAVDAASKTYGDFDPALTYGLSEGSLAFDDSFTGALQRASGENVGDYAIARNTLTVDDGNGSANYDISYVGADLTIDPRAISLVADAKSKVYGQADPSLTYQLAGGKLAFDDSLTGALSRELGENVGAYHIQQNTVNVADGNGGSNYDISYTAADLDIEKARLTVTTPSVSKVYGQADPGFGYEVSGQIVNANLGIDDSALSLQGQVTRQAGENVGSYALNTDGLTDPTGNYALQINEASLTIDQTSLTVVADAGGKVYGYIDPELSYQASGWVVNEALGIDDSGLQLSGVLRRVAGENAGTYQIERNTLADSSGNYAIQYTGAAFDIAQRAIKLAPISASKEYGDADPDFDYTVMEGRLAYDDSISGTVARESGENVGSYKITAAGLVFNDGNDGKNYIVTFNYGNLEITPATLTYIANAVVREIGQENPRFDGSVIGFKNGDSLGSATTGTLAFSSASGPEVGEGEYSIVGSGLTANHGNYVFKQAAANDVALSVVASTLLDGNNDNQLITLIIDGERVEGGGLLVTKEGTNGTPMLVWRSKTQQPNIDELVSLEAALRVPDQVVSSGDGESDESFGIEGDEQPVIYFAKGRWYTNIEYLPTKVEVTLPYRDKDVLAGSSSFIQF